jgi:hypothetical protein
MHDIIIDIEKVICKDTESIQSSDRLAMSGAFVFRCLYGNTSSVAQLINPSTQVAIRQARGSCHHEIG